MLWRLSDYRFISCPCGVTLKVPPAFRGQQVACPKCRQTYLVQASP
jgi:heat shock protein HtpX